ncbi:hypothetical protein ACS764_08265 [Yersinia enterocolitica]|uniref:hypothetical protein n=1 Tax=Yersinia enterocolitica TaxID=630 RepID=UPI002AC7D5FB|nr:hypothetical protein [Yersinia enterocolitica]HEN3255552.1 hypothetical protein [Yersinia enterocolitica]
MNEDIGKILNSSLEIQLNELLKLSTQTDSPKNKEHVAAIIEKIYINNTSLSERFSIKTVSNYLIEKIKEILLNESKGSEDAFRINIEKSEIFTKDNTNKIFNDLLGIKPQKIKVFSPISGINLEKDVSPFKIGPFEIIKGTDIKQPFVINSSLHISVTLHNIYDLDLAISKANDAFKDFIRLVVFISGSNDKNIEIKVGLPILTEMGKNIIYRDSESYFIENEIGEFESFNIKNNIVKNIPIDNEFFFNNGHFKLLWSLYNTREKKAKKTTMKDRLLNSSLALGQSMNDRDIKNSIIYTCISLEILFSFDENSLFQKSISDKLADILVFIVATDTQSRINTSSFIKKFYGLRSALVHGGNKKTNNDYVAINILLRSAINELLNNEKYQHIENIDMLYSMVKEAQYSYSHKP